MEIQLIHPPVYLNLRAMTALRPSPPLGLAYVAAALQEAGHSVGVIDAVAAAPERVTPDGSLHRLGLSPEEIADRVAPGTRALGITNMFSFSWPLVRRILQTLKQRHPEKILIGGGEHCSGLPALCLEQAPLDYVVLGEGEETIVELLRRLESGDRDVGDMPGLAFRRNGSVVVTQSRARIRAVDDIPWPAWQLFDLAAYNDHALVTGINLGTMVPILATRGCPYQCTYCSSPGMWTTRWYARDPIDVVDEIAHYVETYGAKNFPFQDLTAIVKKDWIVRFCQEIIARRLDIAWQFPSGTRCEVIDEEVAELLQRSGGRHLAFAPESGSERTRALIKKRMTTDGLLNAVSASVKRGLRLTIFIVIGFPHDTREDLRATARLVRRLARMGVEEIAIGFFFPIPNTELFDQLMRKGRVDLSDRCLMTPIYANDERLRAENNYCEQLSARRLTWTKYSLLLSFYSLWVLTEPSRLLSLMANVVRGRETRKLETFLIELKRKGGMWVGSWMRRSRSAASR